MKKIIFLLALTITVLGNLSAQTAEEIINTMDNRQTFDTMVMTGTMKSNDQLGTKVTTFTSWSQSSDEFLIELTGSDESGQKILRTGDELYLYYPDAEEIIPMYGAALKQSMFGDISYEDMTEGTNTLEKYDVTRLEDEVYDGTDCFRIEMIAKTRNVPYPKQIVWISKSDFVLLKAEYYSRSDRLLKEMRILETRWFGDRNIFTHMIIEDKIRRNSSTEMIAGEIQVDVDLDPSMFTVGTLGF